MDTASLGRFEHETTTIPSLVTVDDHVIFSFAENSIIRIKDGLFVYQRSDVIVSEETLSVKKDKKMKRWATLVGGGVSLVNMIPVTPARDQSDDAYSITGQGGHNA